MYHPYRPSRHWIVVTLLLAFTLLSSCVAAAGNTVHIAVASNFAETLRSVLASFEGESPHEFKISAASTGKLFAQIKHGAPFHAFLSADVERPKRLLADGYAVPGTRFTYAVGRLALWQPLDAGNISGPDILRHTRGRLAMANPKTAPYGKAARETLHALGLWRVWRPRLVRGENIGQTYQFVASGAVESGFVALSQLLAGKPASLRPSNRSSSNGHIWPVPASLHTPLLQQAVLLRWGEDSVGAKDFLALLRSPEARGIIQAQGYGLAEPDNIETE
uniref:Molybdate transport system substrate-binding protein n=1 Tax=Candidatus Kentrum sp. MB TaxID=2138164 RepID=A0A450XPK0_9GAMM|nr:MAG: molybdate transport system substrate-binding protein [Candidatus Kentron sp. MB]VFK34783.1 MAG: molybdate transport system substrate-binding protein [Candidatus Kentron sp. MB]VFK76945.1 MAG: molybdate transport system substrate-binding protein [Candidatus Kentron sp. MB]